MRKEKLLERSGNIPVYLTDPADMRYYSNFSGEGAVVISENETIILTDGRYTEKAEKETENAVVENCLDHANYLKEKYERIYFQPKSTSVYRCGRFKECGMVMLPFGVDFDSLRSVKDEEELDCMRLAAAIGDKVFYKILEDIKPGVTEKEISAKIDYYLKLFGGDKSSFDTICVSGVNSSLPHGVPTDKKIENGDFVTMDFGCVINGYCSDMTRTVAVGFVTDEMKKVYDTVLKVQITAQNAVKSGEMCKDLDYVARKIIEDAGYGENFAHSLGHGVGLKIHEMPNLSPRALGVLVKNQVVTVEPGIYIGGKFGVRIENTVIVGENSCESLQNAEKELIIL